MLYATISARFDDVGTYVVSRSRSSPMPGVVVDFLKNDTTSYRL